MEEKFSFVCLLSSEKGIKLSPLPIFNSLENILEGVLAFDSHYEEKQKNIVVLFVHSACNCLSIEAEYSNPV